jgi:hypothetical protein
MKTDLSRSLYSYYIFIPPYSTYFLPFWTYILSVSFYKSPGKRLHCSVGMY